MSMFKDALEEVDLLLAEKPDRVGEDFSATTRCLCGFRDELIAAFRAAPTPANRRRLEQANAVLSVIVGGHYPLGPVPWPEIEQAREMLARIGHNAGMAAEGAEPGG
jgi:formate dehydrogenase major subunit